MVTVRLVILMALLLGMGFLIINLTSQDVSRDLLSSFTRICLLPWTLSFWDWLLFSLVIKCVSIPLINVTALPCKAKRRYLLTLQISRYRLLALQGGAHLASRPLPCSCVLRPTLTADVISCMLFHHLLYPPVNSSR